MVMVKYKLILYKGKEITVIKYDSKRGALYDVIIDGKEYQTHAYNRAGVIQAAKRVIDGKEQHEIY